MAHRETLEADVLIVGAGPAGLATALRLIQLVRIHNSEVAAGTRQGPPLSTEGICLLEKGREIGSHLLSGAVMDPRALAELLAGEQGLASNQGLPASSPVVRDEVYFLTEQRSWKLPAVPPFFHNEGNQLVSIGRLGRWLGQRVEEGGATIFSGIAGTELLIDNQRVVGVRTDDKGVDRHGGKKGNFEPGIDVRAKVTVLAEGSRGSLAKQLLRQFPDGRSDRNPQVYAIGVKELWEVPAGKIEPGTVIHSAGWPLDTQQFGGGWLYAYPDKVVSVGLVSGLGYIDPRFDPHTAFQRYKQHPLIRRVLAGGKLLKFGAKTIPEGGWYSLAPLHLCGTLLIGDTAGFLNSQRLKGIHLAIKSGMLAAETIYESWSSRDFSDSVLDGFDRRVRASWIHEELWPVRNYHQAMHKGLLSGAVHVGLQMLTGGRGAKSRYLVKAGHQELQKITDLGVQPDGSFIPDGKLTFDKSTDVFHSATRHEENQPSHLRIAEPDICNDRCAREYANPCQRFCPAGVYEMVENKVGLQLHLNPSNCVHCKTCDIMDPYQIIDWVPPEGGGGPSYDAM